MTTRMQSLTGKAKYFIPRGPYTNYDTRHELFAETVQAIRTSLQSGLGRVFMIGAGTMLLAFLLILAIPEISIDVEVKDGKVPEHVELDLTQG